MYVRNSIHLENLAIIATSEVNENKNDYYSENLQQVSIVNFYLWCFHQIEDFKLRIQTMHTCLENIRMKAREDLNKSLFLKSDKEMFDFTQD